MLNTDFLVCKFVWKVSSPKWLSVLQAFKMSRIKFGKCRIYKYLFIVMSNSGLFPEIADLFCTILPNGKADIFENGRAVLVKFPATTLV